LRLSVPGAALRAEPAKLVDDSVLREALRK
jgi:hypothetical protein